MMLHVGMYWALLSCISLCRRLLKYVEVIPGHLDKAIVAAESTGSIAEVEKARSEMAHDIGAMKLSERNFDFNKFFQPRHAMTYDDVATQCRAVVHDRS